VGRVEMMHKVRVREAGRRVCQRPKVMRGMESVMHGVEVVRWMVRWKVSWREVVMGPHAGHVVHFLRRRWIVWWVVCGMWLWRRIGSNTSRLWHCCGGTLHFAGCCRMLLVLGTPLKPSGKEGLLSLLRWHMRVWVQTMWRYLLWWMEVAACSTTAALHWWRRIC